MAISELLWKWTQVGVAVEWSIAKTLKSSFRHTRGRSKREKKTFTDLRPGPTDHAHPVRAPAESDPREVFLSPQTSFSPLLLSLKSCCSECPQLPATDTRASAAQPEHRAGLEIQQSQLERLQGLLGVRSRSAGRNDPALSGGQRRWASLTLPGLSGPTPRCFLLPTLQRMQGGDLVIGCGAAGDAAASVLCSG